MLSFATRELFGLKTFLPYHKQAQIQYMAKDTRIQKQSAATSDAHKL